MVLRHILSVFSSRLSLFTKTQCSHYISVFLSYLSVSSCLKVFVVSVFPSYKSVSITSRCCVSIMSKMVLLSLVSFWMLIYFKQNDISNTKYSTSWKIGGGYAFASLMPFEYPAPSCLSDPFSNTHYPASWEFEDDWILDYFMPIKFSKPNSEVIG